MTITTFFIKMLQNQFPKLWLEFCKLFKQQHHKNTFAYA